MPLENVRLLSDAGLLGLSTPTEYGGVGAPPEVVRAFMEIIAGACGVTIFVLCQHIVACRHIAAGDNEALKAALLPRLAAGDARAWCVELGVRAAHAAVMTSGGAANLLDHPAQRIFREAMVYTLAAQTSDLQTAMLARLVRRGGERSSHDEPTRTAEAAPPGGRPRAS